MGVIGAITPWNFPLILGMRVVAPALALGNTVVLKPSPETPRRGGMLIAALLADAGLPAGVLNVVTGDQEIGERIVGHPGTSMIHFTGSSAVGSRIAEVAGKQLKRVSLELGGNNALLILDDADLDQAAMIGAGRPVPTRARRASRPVATLWPATCTNRTSRRSPPRPRRSPSATRRRTASGSAR